MAKMTIETASYIPRLARQPLRPSPYPNLLHNEGEVLTDKLGDETERFLIPRGYLIGINSPTSYTKRGRFIVDRSMAFYGFNYLLDNPILTCAIFSGDNLSLFIIDGHQRVRYAGRHDFNVIPTLIATPAQIIEARSKIGAKEIGHDLGDYLQASAAEALYEFYMRGYYKTPQSINGIRDIKELERKFPVF